MKNISLWRNGKVNYRSNNVMRKEIKTDILVIGAGMSGMSVALNLLENNQKFIVVDRKKVGMGVTSNSTGKLTYIQGFIYNDIMKMHCYGTALKYYKSQKEAIEIVVKNIKKYKIDCGYENVDSYLFTDNEKDVVKMKKEEQFYKKAGIDYSQVLELPNGYSIKYGIKVGNTGIFHPLKYLLGLKEIIDKSDNKIYENTSVYDVKKNGDGYVVKTDRGLIYASKVVVCSHSPFFILPGLLPFKSYISKSYILASSTDEIKNLSAISEYKTDVSMRYAVIDDKKYLLFVSNSNRIANTINIKKDFDDFINKYNDRFKDKIDFIWSSHDVMTSDHIPYIGSVSNRDKNLFVATGFNKWGMTNGVIAGKVISDLISNKKNNYAHIFRLDRTLGFIRFIKMLGDNIITGKIFIFSRLIRNHKFYHNVKIVEEDGKKIGIYKVRGREYRVNNTCPHMGCSLLFNEFEKTWDCPCHGSRFDLKGNIISGPSNYSIKLKKKND